MVHKILSLFIGLVLSISVKANTTEPGIKIELGEKLLAHAIESALSRISQGMEVQVRTVPPDKLEYKVVLKHPGQGKPILENISKDSGLRDLVSKPLESLQGVASIEFVVVLKVVAGSDSKSFIAGFDKNSMKIRTLAPNGSESGHGTTVNAVLDFLRTRGFEALTSSVLGTYIGAPGSNQGLPVAGIITLYNLGEGQIKLGLNLGRVNDLYGIEAMNLKMVYAETHEGSPQKSGRIEITGEAKVDAQ
jgi:hypothetical protein